MARTKTMSSGPAALPVTRRVANWNLILSLTAASNSISSLVQFHISQMNWIEAQPPKSVGQRSGLGLPWCLPNRFQPSAMCFRGPRR